MGTKMVITVQFRVREKLEKKFTLRVGSVRSLGNNLIFLKNSRVSVRNFVDYFLYMFKG